MLLSVEKAGAEVSSLRRRRVDGGTLTLVPRRQ